MEYRKLIGFGNSSFVISLPKKWLKDNNLNKGDTIYLDHNGSDIILQAKEGTAQKPEIQTTINTDDLTLEAINRKIVASYINNADIIQITGKGLKENSKEIKKMIQRLVAMETISQTTSKITAKSFLNMQDIQIDNLIRKADHVLSTMLQDLNLVITSKVLEATEISDNIEQRDEDVNKMCFLVFRALNHKRGNYKEMPEDVMQIWGMAFFIEEAADGVKRVAKMLANFENENLKEYVEILNELKEIYKTCMKAYYSQDKELVYEVAKNRNLILKECNNLIEKNSKNTNVISLVEETKDLISKIHNMNRMSY